jgi:hypothetical protein
MSYWNPRTEYIEPMRKVHTNRLVYINEHHVMGCKTQNSYTPPEAQHPQNMRTINTNDYQWHNHRQFGTLRGYPQAQRGASSITVWWLSASVRIRELLVGSCAMVRLNVSSLKQRLMACVVSWTIYDVAVQHNGKHQLACSVDAVSNSVDMCKAWLWMQQVQKVCKCDRLRCSTQRRQ